MEHRQLKCDLVTNTYNISYETIVKAVESQPNLIKIGDSYYFIHVGLNVENAIRTPFKGKLGCELYRGFSFQELEGDKITF